MRLLPLLLLVSACAAAEPGPSSGETDLERELAGRAAGEPRDCVSASPGANLVARGRQTLVYEQGGSMWVNRLAAECPGLDEMSRIVIEVHGSRYCRGDRFRASRPGETIPGPICVLGSFTPYRR
ncbi:MAG TPA: hypothetical protein VFQ67_00955 [Allosphingosinicella sp.]|jgi:hypothetical protein|nr:hypothetical protein [Allosphingosinicella sp.]